MQGLWKDADWGTRSGFEDSHEESSKGQLKWVYCIYEYSWEMDLVGWDSSEICYYGRYKDMRNFIDFVIFSNDDNFRHFI